MRSKQSPLLFLLYKRALNTLRKKIKQPAFWIISIFFIVMFATQIFAGNLSGSKMTKSQEMPAFLQALFSTKEKLYQIFPLFLLIAFSLGTFLTLKNAPRKGASLFSLNDVHLLFVTPLRPATILLFGMTNNLVILFVCAILCGVNLTNLKNLLYLSTSQAIYLIMILILYIGLNQVLRLVAYIYHKEEHKIPLKHLKYLALLPLSVWLLPTAYQLFSVSLHQGKAPPLHDTIQYLSQNQTWQKIPFIGWICQSFTYLMHGTIGYALLYFLGLFILLGLAIFYLYQSRVNYYEDAFISAESLAKFLADAKANRKNTAVYYRPEFVDDEATDETGTANKRKKLALPKFLQPTWSQNLRFRGIGVSLIAQRPILVSFREAKTILPWRFNTVFHLIVLSIAYFILKEISPLTYEIIYLLTLYFAIIQTFSGLAVPIDQELAFPYIYLLPYSSKTKLFYLLLAPLCLNLWKMLPAFLLAGILFKPLFWPYIGMVLLVNLFYFTILCMRLLCFRFIRANQDGLLAKALSALMFYIIAIPIAITVALYIFTKDFLLTFVSSGLIMTLFSSLFLYLSKGILDEWYPMID